MKVINYIIFCFVIFELVSSSYLPQVIKINDKDIINNDQKKYVNQNIRTIKNYENNVDTIIIHDEKEIPNIPYENKEVNILIMIIGGLIGGLIGFFGGSFILFIILIILGFTTGGIAPLSFAAWWMSLYGGYVPAGGIYAMFQSMGALGFTSFLGGFVPILNTIIGFLVSECIIYFFILDLKEGEELVYISNYKFNGIDIMFLVFFIPFFIYKVIKIYKKKLIKNTYLIKDKQSNYNSI